MSQEGLEEGGWTRDSSPLKVRILTLDPLTDLDMGVLLSLFVGLPYQEVQEQRDPSPDLISSSHPDPTGAREEERGAGCGSLLPPSNPPKVGPKGRPLPSADSQATAKGRTPAEGLLPPTLEVCKNGKEIPTLER